ncbi:hypothetical protein [Paraburkholderia sp. BL25I1N1]|uniref:hypothetical protein n=1 Tax=Paraburkholderia sp. BL25I1N1 TaxID=1938804 RepID=UPI000D44B779|nr:hypothetical protein [Paraburkholderia sp. BL25I1N1]PRY08258.1 hypothetical protein B0G73_103351 [Paraburkholderia sp. BL25I1N1]
MFCVIGSEAAAGSAASGEDALSSGVAGEPAVFDAMSLFATAGVEEAAGGVESSAPHPLNAKVASATKAALARRLFLLMSATRFVKAGAVSNPFKK